MQHVIHTAWHRGVALKAGTGHVLSTLAVAVVVWIAGAAVAKRFGSVVDTISSLALIGFGLWIAITAWLSQHNEHLMLAAGIAVTIRDGLPS